MDYMTLKEAAEKWGVTPRRVNYYCAGGRIPGAVKMATIWLIPKVLFKSRSSSTIKIRFVSHSFILSVAFKCHRNLTRNYFLFPLYLLSSGFCASLGSSQ